MRYVIRYCAYPVVMGVCTASIIYFDISGESLWPWVAIIALLGVMAVGLLERVSPYEKSWLHAHNDIRTDIWHNAVNLGIIQFTSFVLFRWTAELPSS